MICLHRNNVFTHKGQSEVAAFGNEIMALKSTLAAIDNLIVYTGFHGDDEGHFDRTFDKTEESQTKNLATTFFPNAQLVWVKYPGLTNDAIKDACNRGNVFFTWCDSDKRVKTVMGWKYVL